MSRRKIEDIQANEPTNKKKRHKNNFKVGEIEVYRSLPHTIGYPSNSSLLDLYKTPVQVGHFSTNSENKFCDDDHQLKYLLPPDKGPFVGMDLKEGYNEYISVYNNEENSFDKLLRWIIQHKVEVKNFFPQEKSSKEGSSTGDTSKEASSK